VKRHGEESVAKRLDEEKGGRSTHLPRVIGTVEILGGL
jgi:hypothetical protein